MTSEHKITYVAHVYDERLQEHEKSETFPSLDSGFQKEIKRSKERVNGRQKLFCKCGGSKEFVLKPKLEAVTVEDFKNKVYWERIQKLPDDVAQRTGIYGHVESNHKFEPVVCPQCGRSYDNRNQVEELSAHKSTGHNISRVRTFVFENEKTLALCCFATKLIVNQRSKKLFSREVKNFISFNKNVGFFIRGGQARRGVFLRKFGLRFISNNVKEVMWELTRIQTDRVCRNLADHERSDYEMLSGIEEFCHRLMFLINRNDAERMYDMFAKEFGDRISELYEASSDSSAHPPQQALFKIRHDFLFEYKLPAIMSAVIYPPIATMFFTKGMDFTLGLLNSWMVPSVRVLKKERPTSPIKILESMVKLKMLEDSGNRRSMSKADLKARELSKKEGKQVYPKRYYKFDGKIPDNIRKGDPRVNRIKVTKGVFRNMKNPEFADALLFASLNSELLPKNYIGLVEKHGIEACAILFRHISIGGRERIAADDSEHVLRLIKKFIDKRPPAKYRHNVSIIYGAPHSPPMDMYADTIRILRLMGRDVSELTSTKGFDQVKALHDRLVKEYENVKNELLEASVRESMSKYKEMDCEIDGVFFSVLDSVSGLNDESAEMKHCVRTYAQSVSEGSSVIFRIKDSSDGARATLGTYAINNGIGAVQGLAFSQLKSHHNSMTTVGIQKAVLKFMKRHKIKLDDMHFRGDLSEVKSATGLDVFPEDYAEQIRFV